MARLNDTEALVRQGVRKPGLCTAGGGDQYYSENEDATASTSGPQPGKFRRETGAGDSSLAGACATACGEE